MFRQRKLNNFALCLDQLTSQLQQMKENKFDLITMFKRKPNYKMNMYGSVDVMGKMKMSDFLHLS